MKVYVDKIPKKCLKCPCFDRCGYMCKINKKLLDTVGKGSADNSRDEDCPLIPLSDYTKQVRKEVLDELCNMLGDRAELIDFGNGCAEFMFTTYDLQECSKVILDQVQGESGHKQ